MKEMSMHRVGEQANKKVCVSVQPVSEEDGHLDRILSLPGGVTDRILELMPIHDAARKCVLSRKWRYMWANHPKMVIDKPFFRVFSMKKKSLPQVYTADIVDIINRMFLHHTGHINNCVLDISVVRPERYCDVDLWLSILSRRGVKELKLENSSSISYSTSYSVPS